jgi:hypothetical protein
VRLFIDRPLASQPRFAVTNHNAPAVAQICHRLDGIPLAIELAAARIKVLTPEQISEWLDHRFQLLTCGSRTALPRQQTLRALVDWSFDLLSDQEKAFVAAAGGDGYAAVRLVAAVDMARTLKVSLSVTGLATEISLLPDIATEQPMAERNRRISRCPQEHRSALLSGFGGCAQPRDGLISLCAGSQICRVRVTGYGVRDGFLDQASVH